MPEDGHADRLDVLDGNVAATAQRGAGFAGEDEVQRGAWASSPCHEFLHELGCLWLVGTGCADEGGGVFEDVLGNRDASNKLLEFEDGRSI